MLLGVVNDKAVTDALEHGDVVIRVTRGGGIGDVDPEVFAQVRDTGALVDTQIHKVDPLAAGVGDIEPIRELGAIGIAERGLGVIGGEINRDLIGLDIKTLKRVDVVDRVVVDAQLVMVLVVTRKHIGVVVAAQNGDSARVFCGAGEQLLIQRDFDIALVDILTAINDAAAVVRAEGDTALDVLEHFLEFGGGASAGGAEYDTGVGELVQTLIEALGQYALVGEKRLVHIDGENLNVADIGV